MINLPYFLRVPPKLHLNLTEFNTGKKQRIVIKYSSLYYTVQQN